jgi:CheY-like chemotaxis protein/anti-sigma regulatory factor (Ser/Thr protein kinase)
MLGRILQNLVSNAIKYTDQGRVLIGCRRRGSDLSIEVWDTGPGIPAESLELIFHDFVQLSNPARQRTRGVGLGLSVARSLAQLLEHSLNVRSTPGKGSVFSVKVPQARSLAPSAGGDSIPKTVRYTGPPGAWILVVEDDPDVMKATSLLLKNLGLRAIEASSGVEAITMLGRQRTEPDLIIVDYQLPDGSGIDIIEQVRRFFGSIMPAVLVAGDTSRNAMSKMEESGSVVLHKPIRADELVVQLNRLLRDRG